MKEYLVANTTDDGFCLVLNVNVNGGPHMLTLDCGEASCLPEPIRFQCYDLKDGKTISIQPVFAQNLMDLNLAVLYLWNLQERICNTIKEAQKPR